MNANFLLGGAMCPIQLIIDYKFYFSCKEIHIA